MIDIPMEEKNLELKPKIIRESEFRQDYRFLPRSTHVPQNYLLYAIPVTILLSFRFQGNNYYIQITNI